MAGSTTDFEAEGLLEGLEEGDARRARLELLRELEEAGVPLEELRKACAEDRVALLPAELAFTGLERYTAAEVAAEAGLPVELLQRHWQALGLPRRADDARAFSEGDLDSARRLKTFLEAGLSEEGVLEVARVVGQGMAAAAEAILTVVGGDFLRAGDTERDVGRRYAAVAEELLPLTGPLLEYQLRVHMRERVRTEVLGRDELSSGEIAGTRLMTVAFADLEGFTRLGERLETAEIGQLAGRLATMAGDVAEPPVRLVKTIGDAAMLVSAEPDPLVKAALDLVAAAKGEGEGFPALRAGVARGSALGRGGDWYGRPVNIASRVTGIARPSSVLTTAEVREAAEAPYRWSFAGRHHLKGVKGTLPLFRARLPSPDDGES